MKNLNTGKHVSKNSSGKQMPCKSASLQIAFGVLLLQRVQRVKNNQKLGIVSSHYRQEREHPTQEVSQRHWSQVNKLGVGKLF